MAEAFSKVGQIFTGGVNGNLGKTLSLGSLGVGGLANMMAQRRYGNIYNNYNKILSNYANMTPQQVAAGVAALQQPLSTGLQQTVGNAVQANMAERGLGQAPGIWQTTLAQALAPYALENQKLATDQFFKMKGLPLEANPMYALATGRPQPYDLSGTIQAAMKAFQRPNVPFIPGGSMNQPGIIMENGAAPNMPNSLPGISSYDPFVGLNLSQNPNVLFGGGSS